MPTREDDADEALALLQRLLRWADLSGDAQVWADVQKFVNARRRK